MYDSTLKIKEKVAFVKILMDYEMREFLLKAYDLAFTDAFGENWLDEFLEIDKQKKNKTAKIAKYVNDECTWTDGLKHADFAASIKILAFEDRYRNAFCKYWGCDKNDNEKNVRLLAQQLHQFRNDCSHINSHTDYAILTPDSVIVNMCVLVNKCSGLCDHRGQLYCEIFQEKYRDYLLMSKIFLVSDLVREINKQITNSEFIKICRKNNIEVSADERSIVTDDIQRVMCIVENDNGKVNSAKIFMIAGIAVGALVVGVSILLAITMGSNDSKEMGSVAIESVDKKENDKDQPLSCKALLTAYEVGETEVLIKLEVLNEEKMAVGTDMVIKVFFDVIKKDGTSKKQYCYFGFDRQIEGGKKESFEYSIPWEKLGIEKDSFESICIEDWEIVERN